MTETIEHVVLGVQPSTTKEPVTLMVFSRVDDSQFEFPVTGDTQTGSNLRPSLLFHTRISQLLNPDKCQQGVKLLCDCRGFGMLNTNNQLHLYSNNNWKGKFSGNRVTDFDSCDLDALGSPPEVISLSLSGFVEYTSGRASRFLLNQHRY